MKKSRNLGKAGVVLSAVMIVAGGAAVLCPIVLDNQEILDDASAYTELVEQMQPQASAESTFPFATGKPWSVPEDVTVTELEELISTPAYEQVHPPNGETPQATEAADRTTPAPDSGIDDSLFFPSAAGQGTLPPQTYPGHDGTDKPTGHAERTDEGESSQERPKQSTRPVSSTQSPLPDMGATANLLPTSTPAPPAGYTGADLAACQAVNPDFIAWLKIPGTNVNYPVVHTNDTDFYLTHDFKRAKNKLGTLFSLGKTDYTSPGKNIAIYGHHITNESSGQLMFRPLLSYKRQSFFNAHSTVYLDSLYRPAAYKIFAVVNYVKGEWDPSQASFVNDADFLGFVQQAKARSLYATDVEVRADDHIITLITCDRSYAASDGRLVILAVEQ